MTETNKSSIVARIAPHGNSGLNAFELNNLYSNDLAITEEQIAAIKKRKANVKGGFNSSDEKIGIVPKYVVSNTEDMAMVMNIWNKVYIANLNSVVSDTYLNSRPVKGDDPLRAYKIGIKQLKRQMPEDNSKSTLEYLLNTGHTIGLSSKSYAARIKETNEVYQQNNEDWLQSDLKSTSYKVCGRELTVEDFDVVGGCSDDNPVYVHLPRANAYTTCEFKNSDDPYRFLFDGEVYKHNLEIVDHQMRTETSTDEDGNETSQDVLKVYYAGNTQELKNAINSPNFDFPYKSKILKSNCLVSDNGFSPITLIIVPRPYSKIEDQDNTKYGLSYGIKLIRLNTMPAVTSAPATTIS